MSGQHTKERGPVVVPDERWFERELDRQLGEPTTYGPGLLLTPTETTLRMLIRHLRGAVGALRNQHGPQADLSPLVIRYLHGLARLPEADAEEFIKAVRGRTP